MRGARWATIGSVFAAGVSSACCWLPLLMLATGFSVVGVSAFFERYRPVLLVLASVLLAVGFHAEYRTRAVACGPDGECVPTGARIRKWNRPLLWISSAVILALILFPSYAGRIVGAGASQSTASDAATLVLGIVGMTCAGCEVAVEAALLELPGVHRADASYEDAGAIVRIDPVDAPGEGALREAVEKAGYALDSIEPRIPPRR